MPSGIYEHKPLSEEHKRNISISRKGKKLSEEHKKKVMRNLVPHQKGYVFPPEIREKCIRARKLAKMPTGKDHYNWKGGITPLEEHIRKSVEYRNWRKSIYKRDLFICRDCSEGGKLEVHHVKPFSFILKEFLQQFNNFSPLEDLETLFKLAITYSPFWDIENGITYCKKCHGKYKKLVKQEV